LQPPSQFVPYQQKSNHPEPGRSPPQSGRAQRQIADSGEEIRMPFMPYSLKSLIIKPLRILTNWRVIMPVAILLLLLVYLGETNSQAEQSFKIRKLEISRDALSEDIRNLTWEVSSARSLATVQARARQLSLGTPKEVSFVQAGFSAVALSNGGAAQ
jgi:cell division protein FtsL